MFRRLQTFTLALLTALLIILGGLGLFIAEASSFPGIIIEAQSYDLGRPIDALDMSPDTGEVIVSPGLPF